MWKSMLLRSIHFLPCVEIYSPFLLLTPMLRATHSLYTRLLVSLTHTFCCMPRAHQPPPGNRWTIYKFVGITWQWRIVCQNSLTKIGESSSLRANLMLFLRYKDLQCQSEREAVRALASILCQKMIYTTICPHHSQERSKIHSRTTHHQH